MDFLGWRKTLSSTENKHLSSMTVLERRIRNLLNWLSETIEKIYMLCKTFRLLDSTKKNKTLLLASKRELADISTANL